MKTVKKIIPDLFKAFQYDDYPYTDKQQDEMSKLFRNNAISVIRDNQHEEDGSLGIVDNYMSRNRIYRTNWIVIYGLGKFIVYTNEEFKKEFEEVKSETII